MRGTKFNAWDRNHDYTDEIKTVEDAVREFESVFPDSTGRHLYPTTMVECKDYIRTSITALLKHAQSEIAKQRSYCHESNFLADTRPKRCEWCWTKHQHNMVISDSIGILEAMIRGV